MEQVNQLLVLPPGEFLVIAGLVVRRRNVVEARGVKPVAVDLDQGAVILEVGGYVRMAVHVAAVNPVLLAARIQRVCADRLHILRFRWMRGDGFERWLGKRGQGRGGDGGAAARSE